MILYNMRERGQLEYDKFALNILQVHNAVFLGEMHELDELSKKQNSLMLALDNVDKIYTSISGNEKVKGLEEEAFKKSLLRRG